MRRCQNCGHKFVITEPPFSRRIASCLGSLIGLIVVATLAVFGCCGGLGWLASRSTTTTSVPKPALSPRTLPVAPINPPAHNLPAAPETPTEPEETDFNSSEPIEPIVEEPTHFPAKREVINPKIRRWTSADGKFTTEAEFGGMAFGKVKLRKANGTIVTVDATQLSGDDREWIKKRTHP